MAVMAVAVITEPTCHSAVITEPTCQESRDGRVPFKKGMQEARTVGCRFRKVEYDRVLVLVLPAEHEGCPDGVAPAQMLWEEKE